MDKHFGKPEKSKKNSMLQAAIICVAAFVGIMILMVIITLSMG